MSTTSAQAILILNVQVTVAKRPADTDHAHAVVTLPLQANTTIDEDVWHHQSTSHQKRWLYNVLQQSFSQFPSDIIDQTRKGIDAVFEEKPSSTLVQAVEDMIHLKKRKEG